MKKIKLICFCLIFSIIIFSFNTKSYANSYFNMTLPDFIENYDYAFWWHYTYNRDSLYYQREWSFICGNYESGYDSIDLNETQYSLNYGPYGTINHVSSTYLYYNYNWNNLDIEMPIDSGTIPNMYLFSDSLNLLFGNTDYIYIIKGNFNNYTTNITVEYSNGDIDTAAWYIEAWNVFQDYFTGKPFEWIKTLGDFWKNRYNNFHDFWNNLFHKNQNGDIITDINIISPTPLPPTPTPIPYSTFIEYDSNNGVYIYKYEYTDVNNNQIIATAPPEQNININLPNGLISDDYYPDDPLNVPRDNNKWSPQFTINLGDGDSIDIDFNTMNDTLIQGAEPYLDDIDASTDLFGAIPQDWFFLIGFCAIIPLICGIINRFLG